MMNNFKKIFMAILFIFVSVSSVSGFGLSVNGTETFSEANVINTPFCIQPNQINDSILYRMLIHYKVKEPKIVLAQAKLETGNYKSNLCRNYYNLFGIKLNGKYAHFKSFGESIEVYLTKIQYKYREGRETYYGFLQRIGYATSANYVSKVKKMESTIKLKI